jgi:hypothetical protein
VARAKAVAQNAATSAETTRNAVAPIATRSNAEADVDAKPPSNGLVFGGLAGKPMRGMLGL